LSQAEMAKVNFFFGFNWFTFWRIFFKSFSEASFQNMIMKVF